MCSFEYRQEIRQRLDNIQMSLDFLIKEKMDITDDKREEAMEEEPRRRIKKKEVEE